MKEAALLMSTIADSERKREVPLDARGGISTVAAQDPRPHYGKVRVIVDAVEWSDGNRVAQQHAAELLRRSPSPEYRGRPPAAADARRWALWIWRLSGGRLRGVEVLDPRTGERIPDPAGVNFEGLDYNCMGFLAADVPNIRLFPPAAKGET